MRPDVPGTMFALVVADSYTHRHGAAIKKPFVKPHIDSMGNKNDIDTRTTIKQKGQGNFVRAHTA
jgi:hypothetical protein